VKIAVRFGSVLEHRYVSSETCSSFTSPLSVVDSELPQPAPRSTILCPVAQSPNSKFNYPRYCAFQVLPS